MDEKPPEAKTSEDPPSSPFINGPASIAFAGIVVLWGLWICYHNYQEGLITNNPDRLAKNTPVIELADIEKYAGTKQGVALHLVTADTDDFGKEHARPDKPAPEAIAFRILTSLKSHHADKGSRIRWERIGQEPDQLTLYSPDHKIRVLIDSTELNGNDLPILFMAADFNKCDLQPPADWVKEATSNTSENPQFKICGLPCKSRVLAVGALSKDKNPGTYKLNRFVRNRRYHLALVKIEPGQPYADEPNVPAK